MECARTTPGFMRYLDTASDQAASVMTPGVKTVAPWVANSRHQPILMAGWIGMVAMFWGTGSENDTFTFYVWDVWPVLTPQTRLEQAAQWIVTAAGSGTATLGATTGGASSVVIPSGARIVDTLAFTRATASTTPKGAGDVLSSVIGRGAGANVYSPADNGPALWAYADAASPYARIIEFVSASGNTANAATLTVR